jgi:hypothetical protein
MATTRVIRDGEVIEREEVRVGDRVGKDNLRALDDRRKFLVGRIESYRRNGRFPSGYDNQERGALTWAIDKLKAVGEIERERDALRERLREAEEMIGALRAAMEKNLSIAS